MRLEPFELPRRQFELSMITLELEFVKAKGPGTVQEQVDAPELVKQLQRRFTNQVFTEDQKVTFEYMGNNYLCTVTGVMVEGQEDKQVVRRGCVPEHFAATDASDARLRSAGCWLQRRRTSSRPAAALASR